MVRYVFLAVCLLITACSDQKKAENYDDFKDRLIFDLFASVEKGDHQKTFKTLSRLRTLISHNAFLDELHVKEENNLALIKVDQALEVGDLNTASMQAVTAEDRVLQRQVESLKIIEDYIVQKPYSTSAKAYSALKRLDGIHSLVAENSHYKKFIAAEKSHADELYKQEYAKLLKTAFDSYSRKLVASSKYADYALLHIDKKAPSKKSLTKVLDELVSFNPELEELKFDDFAAKVKTLDNQPLKELSAISDKFAKGENVAGLNSLKTFIDREGKVSKQLKIELMQKSKKLTRVLAGMEFTLIDDVIDKLEEVNRIEEELRKEKEKILQEQKKALEEKEEVVSQGNYLEKLEEAKFDKKKDKEAVKAAEEKKEKAEEAEKENKLDRIRKKLR